jgi:hypothetical protein
MTQAERPGASNQTLPLAKGELEGVFLLFDVDRGEPPSIPPRRGRTEELGEPIRASNLTLAVLGFGRARLLPSLPRRLGRSLALPKPVPAEVLLDALCT